MALFRLIFPKCKSKKRFCTKFEAKVSSDIALIVPEDRINENKVYENKLRAFYQNEINTLVREKSKEKTPSHPLSGLDALYEKCKRHHVSENIDAYNRQLNALQVSELNIVLNYNLSIRQHRLTLFRDGCRDEFGTHKKLLLHANQRSFINDKVLI